VLQPRHLTRVRELLGLERHTQRDLARAEASLHAASVAERAARRDFSAALFDARAGIAHAQALLSRLGLRVTPPRSNQADAPDNIP
jgi:hypothetical protein